MTGGVTVHTIFWDGGGSTRSRARRPGASVPTYEGMVEQFFTDVAADSTGTARPPGLHHGRPEQLQRVHGRAAVRRAERRRDRNAWVVRHRLRLGQRQRPRSSTTIAIRRRPISAPRRQTPRSASPTRRSRRRSTTSSASHGNARGLHDLWYVFLPPDVDECITAGVCGTNAFGGYHSLSNVRPRRDDLRAHDRPGDRGRRDRPGRRPAGQSRRRGHRRHRRARDQRGDDRSRGRRLDRPERVRGRRQVRVRPAARHPARLRRPDSVAVQPGHQRPRLHAQEMWSNDDGTGTRTACRRHDDDGTPGCRCRRST